MKTLFYIKSQSLKSTPMLHFTSLDSRQCASWSELMLLYSTQSSAYNLTLEEICCVTLFMNNKKRHRPSTDPCGTPDVISSHLDLTPFNVTHYFLLLRYSWIHKIIEHWIPKDFSFLIIPSWHTESNTFLISKNRQSTFCLLSTALVTSWKNSTNWVPQEYTCLKPCWAEDKALWLFRKCIILLTKIRLNILLQMLVRDVGL